MRCRSRVRLVVFATSVASAFAVTPPTQGTTFDNRDAMAGWFSEFALFGGNFADPDDPLNRARVYLAVQRDALHVGYEESAAAEVVLPLRDVDALMLWCPMRDELDECQRRIPIATAFSVDSTGSATFRGHDSELGEMSFTWSPTAFTFNGVFERCISEVFIGDGWYIEWDISLHGPTNRGWHASLSGSVGALRAEQTVCGPLTIRDKAGKVELAWSNEGRTI